MARGQKGEKKNAVSSAKLKRTSIGRYDKPKNKHKRKNWKRYNRQG